jgi:uncharacterized protein YaaQ
MALAVAIVRPGDATELVRRLVHRGFSATRIAAARGPAGPGAAVVLVATEAARRHTVLHLVRAACGARIEDWWPRTEDAMVGLYCAPVEVDAGGAMVFVLPVERVAFLGVAGAAAPITASA